MSPLKIKNKNNKKTILHATYLVFIFIKRAHNSDTDCSNWSFNWRDITSNTVQVVFTSSHEEEEYK